MCVFSRSVLVFTYVKGICGVRARRDNDYTQYSTSSTVVTVHKSKYAGELTINKINAIAVMLKRKLFDKQHLRIESTFFI